MKRKSVLSALLVCIGYFIADAKEQQHAFQPGATCISSDFNCWPSREYWEDLNITVNGNLVTVVPPAKSCYSGNQFNKETCKSCQNDFLSDIHCESHIGSMQNINWKTCGDSGCLLNSVFPSLPQFFGKCSHGALPRYALNSTLVKDIVSVIQFAQKHHIAFNIQNSGHDYLGRSTSPDPITIWTHPLQKIQFHDSFQPENCQELAQKAFIFGGGVKWYDAYRAAHEYNVTVVGGAQAGVGVAGGWLGGGGHSMLTPAYGLGVDQALQFKVILASGELVTVNKYQYSDLFWDLRGGGGGSFGVVTELTMRVYPNTAMQSLLQR